MSLEDGGCFLIKDVVNEKFFLPKNENFVVVTERRLFLGGLALCLTVPIKDLFLGPHA